MSRSYRKPYVVCGYGSKHKKIDKRIASKSVRNAKDIASGRAYAKITNPYDICDYKFYSPEGGWKNHPWKYRRK